MGAGHPLIAFLTTNGITIVVVLAILLITRLLVRLMLGRVRARLGRTSQIVRLSQRLKLQNPESLPNGLALFLAYALALAGLSFAWRFFLQIEGVDQLLEQVTTFVQSALSIAAVVWVINLFLAQVSFILLRRLIAFTRVRFASAPAFLEKLGRERIRDLQFQSVNLISAERLVEMLVSASRLLLNLVILLEILLFVAVVFAIFPQTRGSIVSILTDAQLAISRGWASFVSYLPNLVNLILIVAATYYLLKLIHWVFLEVAKGTLTFSNFLPEWAEPTFKLVRVLVIALALVLAFPYLPGSSSPAFQGISVFAGLLLSLGSTTFIANIIAGIVLTYTRAFRVGDYVQIGQTTGDVLEKTLLVTRIRTPKNEEITVPNGIVMNAHIVNYSAVASAQVLILHTKISIGYDVPWRDVHAAMLEAAKNCKDVLADPPPYILQTMLDDFYVQYELNVFTHTANQQPRIYSELHQAIQDSFGQAKIEILSPHHTALRGEVKAA
ncbi:MAG: mechanosensitive ion channel family protein [Chloroflexi bacterium]|nr:mechanosensitive ion channel family protein [Chloroflexota bacterium]